MLDDAFAKIDKAKLLNYMSVFLNDKGMYEVSFRDMVSDRPTEMTVGTDLADTVEMALAKALKRMPGDIRESNSRKKSLKITSVKKARRYTREDDLI